MSYSTRSLKIALALSVLENTKLNKDQNDLPINSLEPT